MAAYGCAAAFTQAIVWYNFSMLRKIAVEKNEGIAEVIDHILEEPGREAVLVIPKGSLLGKSMRNFHLLKREMDSAGRSIAIESVDETVLAFAKESGFTPTHPFFRDRGSQGVSDIVPVRQILVERQEAPKKEEEEEEKEEEEPLPEKKRGRAAKQKAVPARKMKVVEEADSDDEEDEREEEEQEESSSAAGEEAFFKGDRFFKERQAPKVSESDEGPGRSRSSWKWIGVGLVIVAVVGAALYGVTALFGHVQIAINFKQTPWQYQGTVLADISPGTATATIGANGTIMVPAQVFRPTKNTTQLFPASAEENVSIKSQGTLTIYNAYSSAPQTLVATTRFVTPDGKVFRLAKEVIVPGAQVTNGQIVPSSINVQVIADQPGPDYNIGPVSKLTVPGFANTPKEQGFYGALASSTTGGFIGQKAVPTTADVTAAKAKMTSVLESDLEGSLSGSYPNNFNIIGGATDFEVTKLSVNASTDQNGNFSAFGKATLMAIGFDEVALKAALMQQAQATEPSSTFSSLTLSYGSGTPDFTGGSLTFPLSAAGSLKRAFSAGTFDGEIAGKSIADARAAVAALPELADGSISVWPSWLWSIPVLKAKYTYAQSKEFGKIMAQIVHQKIPPHHVFGAKAH